MPHCSFKMEKYRSSTAPGIPSFHHQSIRFISQGPSQKTSPDGKRRSCESESGVSSRVAFPACTSSLNASSTISRSDGLDPFLYSSFFQPFVVAADSASCLLSPRSILCIPSHALDDCSGTDICLVQPALRNVRL